MLEIITIKKALIATQGNIKNCIFELSPKIKEKLTITITPKDMFEESVSSLFDNIAATINTVSEVVSPS